MTIGKGTPVRVTAGLAIGRTGVVHERYGTIFEQGIKIPQWWVKSGDAGDLVPQRILREDWLEEIVPGAAADEVNLTGAE